MTAVCKSHGKASARREVAVGVLFLMCAVRASGLFELACASFMWAVRTALIKGGSKALDMCGLQFSLPAGPGTAWLIDGVDSCEMLATDDLNTANANLFNLYTVSCR